MPPGETFLVQCSRTIIYNVYNSWIFGFAEDTGGITSHLPSSQIKGVGRVSELALRMKDSCLAGNPSRTLDQTLFDFSKSQASGTCFELRGDTNCDPNCERFLS